MKLCACAGSGNWVRHWMALKQLPADQKLIVINALQGQQTGLDVSYRPQGSLP